MTSSAVGRESFGRLFVLSTPYENKEARNREKALRSLVPSESVDSDSEGGGRGEGKGKGNDRFAISVGSLCVLM